MIEFFCWLIFVIFPVGVVIGGLIATCIGMKDHKDTTVAYSKEWNYGTFEKFKELFEKTSWNAAERNSNTIFETNNSRVTKGIIKFDGKGMVLRWVDFIKFYIYLHRQIESRKDKRNKNLWS